jgi:TonB family protein
MSAAGWNNIWIYALQVGLLVGLAGWIPAAARLRSPKARLIFFQALLAACLLLPALRPWRSEVIAIVAPVAEDVGGNALAAQPASLSHRFDLRDAALAVLAAGALARLSMLALGMLRLRRYRLRSAPLADAGHWGARADVRVSGDITGPVTFGFRRPVILLPAEFPAMAEELREAILCHEALHVRRGDWLFTAAEELIRAGLWFHPAIWWLLGEIQLAREQAVDREAVSMTNARAPYVDALLAAAGAPLQPDLAPAPLFLRKRHLKQRVVSILKEKRMSKTRTVSTLAASLAILAGACWYVTGALPLSAQPQLATDSRGVTVDTMGAQLLHRAPVFYPREAVTANLAGVVLAQVKLDDGGNVADASILSGPDGLRKAVLQSLLSWHFTKDVGGTTRQISVTFRVPEPVKAPAVTTEGQSVTVTSPPLVNTTPLEVRKVARQAPVTEPGQDVVRSIKVENFGMPADDVISKLPLHLNDVWTPESMSKLVEAMKQIDEHLTASVVRVPPSGVSITISAPRTASAEASPVGPITVGGRVQASKLISNPQPVYPAMARAARISGTVEIAIVLSPDGHVQEAHVMSGHPLLRQAALDAVIQWVYQPTLLNGQPVAVSTTVDVIFTLSQ